MLDISMTEFALLIGVGVMLTGRQDLPKAARYVGSQIGRAVGFAQGARTRADRYAAKNEMARLQNELRTSMRQLDAIKSEVTTLTGQGFVGRGMRFGGEGGTGRHVGSGVETKAFGGGTDTSARTNVGTTSGGLSSSLSSVGGLAPRSQSVAAVAEEEWVNRGIGFKSRAEMGVGGETGGSGILADVYQQSLIYDQYDRVMQEQNELLAQKRDEGNKDEAMMSLERDESK